MNLIIIEGEQGKSESRFWDALKNCYFPEIVIGCLHGYGELKRNLDELVGIPECEGPCKKAKKSKDWAYDRYENILVCYDTTAYASRVEQLEFTVNNHIELAKDLGINMQKLEYYCFEDCLLLFDRLAEWICEVEHSPEGSRIMRVKKKEGASLTQAVDDGQLLRLYSDYYTLGTSRQELSKATEPQFYEYLLEKPISEIEDRTEISKEQVAGQLLKDLTRDTMFEVNKGKLSDCWVADCLVDTRCLQLLRMEHPANNSRNRQIECGQVIRSFDGLNVSKIKMILDESLVLKQLKGIGWLAV